MSIKATAGEFKIAKNSQHQTTNRHNLCHTCGTPTQPAGTCSVCPLCGDTSGCS